MSKKATREKFRTDVLSRDGNKCRKCGDTKNLEVHHILNRKLVPDGGYIKENGISLCPSCHKKAELFYETGQTDMGYDPNSLYDLINSSMENVLLKCVDKKNTNEIIDYIGTALSYLEDKKNILNEDEKSKLDKIKKDYSEIT